MNIPLTPPPQSKKKTSPEKLRKMFKNVAELRVSTWRRIKVLSYVVFGILAGVLPLVHILYLSWFRGEAMAVTGFSWVFLSGLCYLTGAVFYSTHFPERWWPGQFDLWLSSHQVNITEKKIKEKRIFFCFCFFFSF